MWGPWLKFRKGPYSGVRRKFSWGVHSVAYGAHLFVAFGFQTNVLAKFVDIICLFFYTPSPYFMCHSTEYKLSALQVRISEENKPNAATQEFITAKFWLRVEKVE